MFLFKACVHKSKSVPGFTIYMPQRPAGTVNHHPWTRVTHHPAYALLHVRPIAMDGALAAGGFRFPVRAMPEACLAIVHEFTAAGTHFAGPFMMEAIDFDHHPDGGYFFFYSVHSECKANTDFRGTQKGGHPTVQVLNKFNSIMATHHM